MENITIGQVSAALVFIVAFAAAVKSIKKDMKKWVAEAMKDQVDALKKDLESLKKNQDSIDLENCKNYLVTFLSELERGEPKDEIEYQRFWEQYEHYTSKGGNTYIKHRVDLLKSINKL